MRAVDIIARKRDGGQNSREELQFLIEGGLSGAVSDEQLAAWLMAVYFRGMCEEETAALTELMEHSGRVMDFSGIDGIVVDKHSTGGVGDKTTLVAAPLAAAAGVPVGKLSGRGLGFTGGTVDKLESIPGFRTAVDTEQFLRQVREIGLAVAGQTTDLVPADKKLYALRDVTATVESIPLIASSIMSKKLASGAACIVLDVKFGSGAFMRERERAEELARTMVKIGTQLGRRVVAVLSSMEQPLGNAVGNSLEVAEAEETLRGGGPGDLRELSLALAGRMIYLGEKAPSPRAGYRLAEELLESGAAWEKFSAFVAAQGGDLSAPLPRAALSRDLRAEAGGFIRNLDAKRVGHASMLLGAGREQKTSLIDLGSGILLEKKVGDAVRPGEVLARMFFEPSHAAQAEDALCMLRGAYGISDAAPETAAPLIWKVIGDEVCPPERAES